MIIIHNLLHNIQESKLKTHKYNYVILKQEFNIKANMSSFYNRDCHPFMFLYFPKLAGYAIESYYKVR